MIPSVKNDNTDSNGHLSKFTDLLFSIVFGASFAFKLTILHDPNGPYHLDPGTSPLPYVGFFGYSILFVILYWWVIRYDVAKQGIQGFVRTSLVIIATMIESLTPYPALDIALKIDEPIAHRSG